MCAVFARRYLHIVWILFEVKETSNKFRMANRAEIFMLSDIEFKVCYE